MSKTFRSILTILLFTSIIILAEDSPFVRYPAINSNGTQIAFSYQGDIWTVPATGGKAVRLTIHEAYDGYPQWSNDDSQIAFSSDRFGNNDIYVMPAEGGTPKRLTYHSASDVLNDWASNGELLFTSNRLFQQVE